jgi:hypothetical protein
MSAWSIPLPSAEALSAAEARQRELTKPPGRLGQFESLAQQVAECAALLAFAVARG